MKEYVYYYPEKDWLFTVLDSADLVIVSDVGMRFFGYAEFEIGGAVLIGEV